MMLFALLALFVPMTLGGTCDCQGQARIYQDCNVRNHFYDDQVHHIPWGWSWERACQGCINNMENHGMNVAGMYCEKSAWGIWVKGTLRAGRSVTGEPTEVPVKWASSLIYTLVGGIVCAALLAGLAVYKIRGKYATIPEAEYQTLTA